MTIRRSIPLYIGLTFLCILGVFYGVAHVVMLRSFSELETRDAERTLAHAVHLVSAHMASLRSIVTDWATWNDCYDFMGGTRPDFLERNVLSETFRTLHINLMAFFDESGTMVAARWHDDNTGTLITPPADLVASLTRGQDGTLLRTAGTAGMTATSEGPMIVAASPILTGAGEGPRRGTLVMARVVDSGFAAEVGRTIDARVTILSLSDSLLNEELPGSDTTQWSASRVVPLSGSLVTYAPLPAPPGGSPVILRAAVPRALQQLAAQSLWYAMAGLACAGLAFTIISIVLSERLVLARLARLADGVRRVGVGASLGDRLPVDGKDELSDLGAAINAMLDTIQRSQTVLRQSEERFRRMADSIADGLAIIEGDTTVYVNDRACQIFGYPREELLQLTGLDLAAPEEEERIRSIIDDARQHGTHPDALEFWIQRRDGTRRCVHNRYSLSRVDKTITGRFVVTTDVTERKIAEHALERLKDFNQRILQTMAEGLVVDDRQGIYTYVNPAAASMLGYNPDELVGRPWHQVVPEDQRAVVEEANRRRKAGTSDRYELEVVRKDGSRLHTLVSGSPLIEGGQVVGTIAVFTDITSQKREEREREELLQHRQQQAEQIRRIMDTVPEGVVVIDETFHVVLANSTAEEYLKVLREPGAESLSRLGGVSTDELFASTEPEPWREIRPPESDRIFELAMRPLDSRGWVVVIRDVTHERAAQLRTYEAERMAAVGQVASGVAHDFNNILASVIGHTQLLLRDRSLPASITERLQSIAEQGHRAASLVGQLLDYTRQSLVDRVPVDLNAVLGTIDTAMAGDIPDQVTLLVRTTSAPCWVEGNATQLRQVVVNLVRNAIDAMPSGGEVHLTLAAQRLRADSLPSLDLTPGEWAILRVSDTGRGIPPEYLPRLFQPFFTTKDVGKGTGLGLAQAWGLIRQHGGFIDVATAVNRGTTFTVYLPVRHDVAKPTVRRGPEPACGHGNTILLVEDEPAVLEVATAMLEEFGFDVIQASSGSEALEIHQRRAGDIVLVLTDLMMPGMDGITLVEKLIARDPSIRVLVVSGHPLDEASRARLSPACVGWLQKPVVMEQLMEAVGAALGRTS